MKIPKSMTEKQVLEIFENVINKLAYKYRFRGHELQDLYQEGMIAAMQGLENYDESRPLENFIFIHVRNRLINFKRDNYLRHEKPCIRCPIKAYLPPDGCSAFKDKMDCEQFSNWTNRNIVKRNLINPLEYGQVNAVSEKNMGYDNEMIENINSSEILELIDKNLPLSLRKWYLMLLSGTKIPKKERLLVEEAIIKIIKDNKYDL